MRVRAMACAVLLLAALTGCRVSMVDLNPGWGTVSGDTYRIDAVFDDALNLPVHGQVKLAGTVVGEVAKVTTQDYHAVVEMRITKDIVLYEGTTATLRLTAPLGELYVALYPPASQAASRKLEDGALLGLDRTTNSANVEDTLAALSLVMTGGGIQDIKTIIGELNNALEDRTKPTRAVLAQVSTMVTMLDRRGADLDSLLVGLDSLSSKLVAQNATISRSLETTAPLVTSIAEQRHHLVALIRAVDRLSVVSNRVISATRDGIVSELQQASPVLDELLAQEHQLGPMLRDLSRFSRELAGTIRGDYISLDINGEYLQEGIPGLNEPLPELPGGIGSLPMLSGLLGGG